MSIKTILLPLREAKLSEAALRIALRTARRFDAHLEVLYVRPNPRDLLPYATLGLSASMAKSVTDAAERNASEQAEAAREAFMRVCERSRVPVVDRPAEAKGGASAAWHEETGRAAERTAVRGRLSDLIIITGPVDVSPPSAVVEAALRESGQPVLVLPQKLPKSVAVHVGVGWNGSAEAARAVSAGMPTLTGADSVTIFTTRKRMGMPPNADALVEYLGWHGVQASVHVLDIRRQTVAEAMLADAAQLGVDFLLIGAYSRRRMREMLFGGVTAHVLARSGLPVLMAH